MVTNATGSEDVTQKIDDPTEAAFYASLGADIRRMREAAALTQQDLANLLDWSNRGAIQKVEAGLRRLNVYDYLRLLNQIRDIEPDHPAIPLYHHIRRRQHRAPGE